MYGFNPGTTERLLSRGSLRFPFFFIYDSIGHILKKTESKLIHTPTQLKLPISSTLPSDVSFAFYLNRQASGYLLVDIAHLITSLEDRQTHQDASLRRAEAAQVVKLLDDGHINRTLLYNVAF